MLGGKTQAQQKPTALGSLVNASTYGATIPIIYGTGLATLLAIWAANLRKGSSGKKAKMKGKKGRPPTYVENVDFLLGQNPIEGVLQMWSNNTNRYTLDFQKQPSGISNAVTISDPNFYFVVGVTVGVRFSGTFADYGDPNTGAMQHAATMVNYGSGYNWGDIVRVDGSDGRPALIMVTDNFANLLIDFMVLDGGSGFHTGVTYSTTNLSGAGSGAQISLTSLATRAWGGVYEQPCWNAAQHGPDLIHAGGARHWPFVYSWRPSDGNVVKFFGNGFGDFTYGIPNGNGTVYVYYARKNSSTKHLTPLAFNRMHFEQELGDGSEFSDAGLSAQQIIYPFYAGIGSSRADLGTTGMLPQWRVEVKGSHALHPRGDADFADMIEDAVKSGMLQTGAGLGLIHRGVNCNTLPGFVQQACFNTLEPSSPGMTFQQPNRAGSILLALSRWRDQGGTDPTVSDTPVNTWAPLLLGSTSSYFGMWYALNCAAAAGNVVQFGFNGSGFGYDNRSLIAEVCPGFDTVDNTATNTGSGTSVNCSITVSQAPALLVALVTVSGEQISGIPPHWSDSFFEASPYTGNIRNAKILTRIVTEPGTYSIAVPTSFTGWAIGMLAIVASQPVPYPVALGNIVDHDSLNNVRAMDRAGGLIGSVVMNAQRKTSEWLEEFYKCANAWPVWSGFRLKSIARSEVSAAGAGSVYTAPTAAGPVAELAEDDLVGDTAHSLVTIARKAQVDANNVLQIEHTHRDNDYHVSTVSEPESGAITLFGPRKQAPISLHEIQDPAVARKILNIEIRRLVYLRNTYKFTVRAKWLPLEAGDLVTIDDPITGLDGLPVRLTSVTENDNFELECEAEPFIYGVHAPQDMEITTQAGYRADSSAEVDLVNPPVFLEPVPRQYDNQNERQLWIGVSDGDEDYGGCVAFLSTDGGSTYNEVGTILGNAATGVTVGAWPSAADPDTANDLAVDLTESLGTLASYSVADEDNFLYPCYVEGGTGGIPYELMTYAVANLTAANQYTLKATGGGNKLRRAVFGAPQLGTGVSHAGGSRFLFLDPAGTGLLKLTMDDKWIGVTLHFKFCAFNKFGGGQQELADVVDYTYTPAGTVGAVNPGGVPPQVFLVN